MEMMEFTNIISSRRTEAKKLRKITTEVNGTAT
jgi:hypothetical protein